METDMLTKEDLVDLQRTLALADAVDAGSSYPNDDSIPIEFLIARFEHVKVQMYRESGPHKRPHFHVEYKRQFRASYAIDTLERIVGYMPKQYERPAIEWARTVQPQLEICWKRLSGGSAPLELEVEAAASVNGSK